MITREDFKKYIEFILKQEEFENKLNNLFIANRDIIGDAQAPISVSQTIILELLEKALGLPTDQHGYTTLSWWAYEQDFGKSFTVGNFENLNLPEDHKYRKPDIKELDDLYDYLIWEAETQK